MATLIPYGRYGFTSNSPKMQKVYEAIDAVAAMPTTVLILGETGTGKELAARAIHKHGRYGKNFVAVNCSAIPESLVESEMFGHVRGAYTGAVFGRVGKIQLAEGGTLFLDEIGEMPLAIQPKLLRVLQDKAVTVVGSNIAVPVDFRLIAATNRNLADKVAAKEFRDDLYYRLSVFQIHLPPLREREGDVDLLAEHFIRKYAAAFGLGAAGASKDALRLLNDYPWPGNVRELESTIESAMAWKKYSGRLNGHAESRLEYGDLMKVWNGRGSRSLPEPGPAPLANKVIDFWREVATPYREHRITKAQVEGLIRAGLEEVGGVYRKLLPYFGVEDSDVEYKRFIDFTSRHKLKPDYREYRQKK